MTPTQEFDILKHFGTVLSSAVPHFEYFSTLVEDGKEPGVTLRDYVQDRTYFVPGGVAAAIGQKIESLQEKNARLEKDLAYFKHQYERKTQEVADSMKQAADVKEFLNEQGYSVFGKISACVIGVISSLLRDKQGLRRDLNDTLALNNDLDYQNSLLKDEIAKLRIQQMTAKITHTINVLFTKGK